MSYEQATFMAAAGAGAVGMWLMLPRASARGRASGIALGLAALGMLLALIPPLGSLVAGGVFYILAGVTIAAAAATVCFRNPIYSAVWFGLTLLGTAGLFLFQGAQFLAVATVVVYAGAILVTFLFVLMLAQPRGDAPYDRLSWEALVSAASGAVLVGVLSMTVTSVLSSKFCPHPATTGQIQRNVLADDHVARVGAELFGRHLIAVEVAGVLLLAALVGAAVIVAQSRPAIRPSEDAPLPRSDRREVTDA